MKTEQSLTLASASPRRRELLTSLEMNFRIVVPEIEEIWRPGEAPRTFAERLAEEKANAVNEEGIIIAADTIVVQNDTILGKPKNAAQAHEMLTTLSGTMHKVITGVCVKDDAHGVIFSVSTQVVFRILEEAEIISYVATGEPMDKAGAYAIQGGAAHMIQSINGSYTNVVGLPLCELYETLLSF